MQKNNWNTLIITNSFKRDKHLVERSLLNSLKQKPAPKYVYFIDQNESKLKLSHEIKSFQHFHHFHVKTNCVSSARNSVKIPKDVDWIIFCDDDGYLKDNYLKTWRQFILQNPKYDVIAGSIVRDDNDEFYSPRHKIGGDLNHFKNTKLLMGSNFSCKAEVFKKLQGFDEQFGAGSYWGSGEETDFAWKAYFNSIPMTYQKDLIVYHIRPYALGFSENIRKAFRYGIGKGALVSKWFFFERKLIVAYEVFEMTAIPLGQMLMSIIKFKWQNIPLYFSVIISRYLGMLLYIFKGKRS